MREGLLSRLELTHTRVVAGHPVGFRPVHFVDTQHYVATMGLPLLAARVDAAGASVWLVSCHLKSKLLSFPCGRFSTNYEGERARFGAYALYRRAAEAVTVRATATELLDGQGRQRAVV